MPTTTYIALATITLTGNDSEIIFSNIPNTYRHLVVTGHFNCSGGSVINSRINGSNANLARVRIIGFGSVPYTDYAGDPLIAEYSGWSNFVINIMDYSATDKNKILLSRTNNTDRVQAIGSSWASTTAINSYGLIPNGSFISGSTFSLYGIAG